MHAKRSASRDEDDDLLPALPPMDGDDDDLDPRADDDTFESQVCEEQDDSDDAVDDALNVGQLVEAYADSATDYATEDDALELGETAASFADEPRPGDDDQLGAGGEDLSLGVDLVADEASQESDADGPLGEQTSEIDEAAFPELDSDDELDLPGDLHLGELEVAEETPLPPPASVQWERVVTPLVALPMGAVTTAADAVVAAGQAAVMLCANEREMTCEWLAMRGCARVDIEHAAIDQASPDNLLLASNAVVLRSSDGGQNVAPVTLPRHGVGEPIFAVGFVGSPAVPFVLRGTTLLANCDDQWTPMPLDGYVLGIAVEDAKHAVAVVLRPQGTLGLMVVRNGMWFSRGPHLPDDYPRPGIPLHLALRGTTVAMGWSDGTLIWSHDAGQQWSQTKVPGGLRAVAAVPGDDGTDVVAAVFMESTETNHLLRVKADGRAFVVAEISADIELGGDGDTPEGSGAVSALVWDEARGWLWVAGRFGLQAWRPVFAA